ncbi:group III truncated hemoglobin [Nitrosomonas sp. JL21]|uniref:group III truncated hemoglobin n=1 Tax=Nitrosomonas sp. JL21 TaxID=153949 RepID=UPI00136C7AE0|nr:group III truncated hemoglobin [Nitrosomonas sp. JL21]MBL8496446.1 group III truncated hemoglobin [Nitrosomonas sp.]MCC7091927.1 group III truncated hemoglobin [Nitrosomonas sp.]MXS78792.1 group III truncated hemoglobin [Nitrosomonas sp. JL21]
MNHSPFPTPNPDRYTEEEISQLVHTFYAKARKDPSLGPIFEAHVIDWDAHFVQMTNFWSAQLRGTSRFRGAPMPKHIALPELTAELFERWLQLFKQTTEELGNPDLQQHADAVASFIATRLWQGYQMNNYPDRQLVALHTA